MYILIVLGAFTFFIGFLGCAGAICENLFLLGVVREFSKNLKNIVYIYIFFAVFYNYLIIISYWTGLFDCYFEQWQKCNTFTMNL